MSRRDFLKNRPKNNDGPHVIQRQSFAGVIKQVGVENKLTLKSPVWYQNYLNTKFKPGENVSVIITTQKPKRSVQQNNYWWVYMTMIGAETGHTPEEIHEWAKGMFLTKKVIEVFGKMTRIKGSTTELSLRFVY